MNQIDEEQEATSATALHKKVSLGQSFKAMLNSDRGTDMRKSNEVNPDLADISTLRKDEATDQAPSRKNDDSKNSGLRNMHHHKGNRVRYAPSLMFEVQDQSK